MGTKSDGQVEVDDNGYVMGSSEKGAYFRVHASKSETDHNLGLHIQLVFENGEIRYSTHHENWICPYISRHLLSLNPLLACCRRYSRG
ncbi:hypothetical protein OU667_21980, partial [Escherichia coli]|nr:hypothetical protein [Escherichia coli]MDF8574916.1 hypothetical protein [Escherichia coli]